MVSINGPIGNERAPERHAVTHTPSLGNLPGGEDPLEGYATTADTDALDTRLTTAEGDIDTLQGQAYTTVLKTADESVNNGTTGSTLQDDNELLFSVAASKTYQIEILLIAEGATAADIKVAFSTPASPTHIYHSYYAPGSLTLNNGTAAALLGGFGDGVGGGGAIALDVQTSAGPVAFFHVVFVNGSNAGSFKVQWAQNSANATNTTVKAGSWLRWRLMN